MLVFWIIMAAIGYFILLAWMLVFFAGVSRMNRHWERAFHDSQSEYDEHWHRAA